MPIFSYQCVDCNRIWDELRHSSEKDDSATCSKCEAPANRRVTSFGGYTGNTGSSSTRPKNAASKGSGEQLNFDFIEDEE